MKHTLMWLYVFESVIHQKEKYSLMYSIKVFVFVQTAEHRATLVIACKCKPQKRFVTFGHGAGAL